MMPRTGFCSRAARPVAIALLLLTILTFGLSRRTFAQSGNAIIAENSNPGTPGWFTTNPARAHQIEGYASRVSAAPGDTVNLYVNTSAPTYTVSLFRLGWYGGVGARLIAQYGPFPGLQQVSPTVNSATGFIECSWQNPLPVTIGNWTTGSYVFRLERPDGLQSYVPFVVRAPSSTSSLLFSCSVNTYQAYNQWGGESLYYSASGGSARTHAFEVSFDRPYDTYDWNAPGAGQALLWEYPTIRWLEKQGYDVSYTTDIDTHENGGALLSHRVFISGGHDEYWTRPMYDAVQNARDSGVGLMFLGANACFWQVRTDASPQGADRRIIGYKNYAFTNDPDYGVNNALVTTSWRDRLLGRPENSLAGIFYQGYMHIGLYQPMDLALGSDPEFAAIQTPAPQYAPNIMGYEYDVIGNNGATPPGLEILSTSPVVDATTLPAISHAVRYTAPSGARVFASGSIAWGWGLDGWESLVQGRGDATSPAVQQLMTQLITDATAPPVPTGAVPLAQVTQITPQASMMAPGASVAFAAAVGGNPVAPVVWSISSGAGVASVDQTGLVSISQSAPNGAQAVVNVKSSQYPTQSASAMITVQTPQNWRTAFLAGTRLTGFFDGAAATARFDSPEGVAADPQGNIYVADEENMAIRVISGGQTSTLAGGSNAGGGDDVITVGFKDGQGGAALFNHPSGLAFWNGNLAVSDAWNNAIRVVTPAGAVTTLTGNGTAGHVDGLLSQAQFNLPSGLAVAPSGYIYVADTLNHCIRTISPDGVVGTAAGTGQPGFTDGAPGTSQLYFPYGLVWTNAGLVIADSGNHAIRLLDGNNTLSTLAGTGAPGYQDGPASAAQFSSPSGVFSTPGGLIWIVDHGNNVIRSLDPVQFIVSTVINSGAPGQYAGGDLTSQMNAPVNLTSAPDGSLLVTDLSEIYRITPLATATGVASVSILPSTVPGKLNATGLVALNGVSAVPTLVSLSTTNSAASVPASVTIPAGAASQSFTILTQPVAQPVTGTVTAALNGLSQSANLTVRPIGVRTLVLSSFTVTGGQGTTGTVYLEAPALYGQVISLASSNPLIPVPASITVPAGSISQSFAISTTPVSATTFTQLSASANGRVDTRTLTVVPPVSASVVVSPYTMIGTQNATGTVTLNGIAAASVSVTLTTTNSAASVPPSVTVPAGSNTATFTVASQFVTSSTAGFVYASAGGTTVNTYIVVRPIGPASFALSPSTVIGGQSLAGTVTLEVPPPAPTVVTFTSSNSSVGLPASLTIPAGATSASFPITTQWVAASTNATLTATANGRPTQKTLTMNPALGPIPISVTVTPSTLMGTATATATVTLNVAPTVPLVVNIASSVSAALVPTTVTVAAGSTSQTFAVTTLAVTADVTGSITAASYAVSSSGAITIVPIGPSSLTFSPSSVLGGQGATGMVTLQAAPPTATLVTLASANQAVGVPATVTVPAGATSQTFPVTSQAVSSTTNVSITATANGLSANGAIALTAAGPTSLTFNPSSVLGGQGATGTVTLQAAPPTATLITLTSASPAVGVPATVTVPAGSTSQTFPVTTQNVGTSASAVVTATANGLSAPGTINLTPAVPVSIVITPSTTFGTIAAAGTVTMNGVLSVPLVVSITSTVDAAAPPATITIPAGAASQAFTIVTQAVSSATGGNIVASANGVSVNSAITIVPIAPATLALTPVTILGGQTSTGTVTLQATPGADTVVTLASSDPSAVVPASVTVPAGFASASFPITTKTVAASTNVTLTAIANGQSVSNTLTENPAGSTLSIPAVLAITPSTVMATAAATGTLTISRAQSVPLVVNLGSTIASAIPPATLTVPAGATSQTFTINTQPVTATAIGNITATANGVTVNGYIAVRPIGPASLTLSPQTLSGGSSSLGTVTLETVAPTAMTVSLTSSNPAIASLPASVVVPAGATTQTFTISTTTVAAKTNVTLTATANGRATTKTLTVSP